MGTLVDLRIVVGRLRRVTPAAFNVTIVSSSERNAWAYTDTGAIRVTSGGLGCWTRDELAWVVAHEIAHIENGDCRRAIEGEKHASQQMAEHLQTIDDALKARHILLRVGALIIAGLAATATAIVSSKATVRSHETEADDRATELTAKAGFCPGAGITALAKTSSAALDRPTSVHDLFADHPRQADRLEAIARKADALRRLGLPTLVPSEKRKRHRSFISPRFAYQHRSCVA